MVCMATLIYNLTTTYNLLHSPYLANTQLNLITKRHNDSQEEVAKKVANLQDALSKQHSSVEKWYLPV